MLFAHIAPAQLPKRVIITISCCWQGFCCEFRKYEEVCWGWRGVEGFNFEFMSSVEARSAVGEVLGLREYDISATWQHMLNRVNLPFGFFIFQTLLLIYS